MNMQSYMRSNRNLLKKDKHQNENFQDAFNKFGETYLITKYRLVDPPPVELRKAAERLITGKLVFNKRHIHRDKRAYDTKYRAMKLAKNGRKQSTNPGVFYHAYSGRWMVKFGKLYGGYHATEQRAVNKLQAMRA